ncbi:hypothetical protein HY480_01780 [Candidatus Uhrbacteria bacterium]|nr:hypothetical protein [Candidatus Uhrbacteria bacterium]
MIRITSMALGAITTLLLAACASDAPAPQRRDTVQIASPPAPDTAAERHAREETERYRLGAQMIESYRALVAEEVATAAEPPLSEADALTPPPPDEERGEGATYVMPQRHVCARFARTMRWSELLQSISERRDAVPVAVNVDSVRVMFVQNVRELAPLLVKEAVGFSTMFATTNSNLYARCGENSYEATTRLQWLENFAGQAGVALADVGVPTAVLRGRYAHLVGREIRRDQELGRGLWAGAVEADEPFIVKRWGLTCADLGLNRTQCARWNTNPDTTAR